MNENYRRSSSINRSVSPHSSHPASRHKFPRKYLLKHEDWKYFKFIISCSINYRKRKTLECLLHKKLMLNKLNNFLVALESWLNTNIYK